MARRLSPRTTALKSVTVLVALGFGVLPNTSVLAADGSGSSNQALLRGGYQASDQASCANAIFCDIGAPVQPSYQRTPPVQQPQARAPRYQSIDCDVIDLSAGYVPGCEPEVAPAQHYPEQPTYIPNYARQPGPFVEPGPQFEADWQIALRGTYDWGTNGGRFGLALTPQVSVTRQNSRGAIVVSANASLVAQEGTEYRLSSGTLDFNTDYNINRLTALRLGGALTISQASSVGVDANTGTAREPIIVTGSADVGLSRRSGRFTFEGRGSFNRSVYGMTELTGGTQQDNSFRNQLGLGLGGRASFDTGGPIGLFIDGAVDRDSYDAASPTAGDKLDSWTFAGRAGVSGNWNNIFTAEISAGYGLRRFDSALLSDAPTALFDAALTYQPDGPLTLSALFGTEITVPDTSTGASTSVTYSGSANGLYQVNDRWALRANLGGSWTRFEGITDTRTSVAAGVGADFNINQNTSVNADYVFGLSDSTTDGTRENHQVGLGVTYSR